MACAASTEPAAAGPPAAGPPTAGPPAAGPAAAGPAAPFDPDAPWQLAAHVRVRPEAFGALLYHFGTRQLSFVKSPALLTVVRSLAAHPSARAACAAAGVPARELPAYDRALATLAASRMICRRGAA